MPTSADISQSDPGQSSPDTWDLETLRSNWIQHLKAIADRHEFSIPLQRIQYQAEQSPIYQEIMKRWPGMEVAERTKTWEVLLESSEEMAREVLPICVQCGECCRKGSPTLQLEDLELLRQGRIPWDALFTIRRGEPVRSPFEENLFFLLDERVKILENPDTQECVFFDNSTNQCMIYDDRPLQCRAQACWDPAMARQASEQPYLTRRDIFQEVELLMELIDEHDLRCSFEKLDDAFKRLGQSRGESINEILELLAYEDHFRKFLGEQFNIPEKSLSLVFGRSFTDLVPVFGFLVRTQPDGSRCLVPEPNL